MEEEKPAKPVFNSKTQLGTWQQELWNAVEELPDGPAKEKLAKLMKTGPARKKAVLGRRGWQADLARRMVIGLRRLSDVEAIRPLTGPWSGLPCSVRSGCARVTVYMHMIDLTNVALTTWSIIGIWASCHPSSRLERSRSSWAQHRPVNRLTTVDTLLHGSEAHLPEWVRP